jgi:magnesium chelatase subunit I
MATPSRPTTLGELKSAGYRPRTVHEELRHNLLGKLRNKESIFEGIIGYDETVIPQVVNALLARHNLILLGLRGQAKTRILRQLVNLLDDEIPVIAGTEVNDDPLKPISRYAKNLIDEKGDDTPIEWITREERYREKLATPDVSIADLIGDLDPIKAATHKLSFSHEEVINFGIIPRTNRGIFAINELPDLQPRIQVGLFNILEEKDVQIRGFPVRLPMDLVLVFTANPEDYTNRGSIITPLKDRIESQIITHYPSSLDEQMAITEQEAWQEREATDIVLPDFVRRIVDRIAFQARESEYVDQASGVSSRLSISALENVVSNAERRAALTGATREHVRIIDLQAALPAMTGKLELVYEGEQEGPFKVATMLVGEAVRAEFEDMFPGVYKQTRRRGGGRRRSGRVHLDDEEASDDLGPYKATIEHFSTGKRIQLRDDTPFAEYQKTLEGIPGLADVVSAYLDLKDGTPEAVVAQELVLEGLHQCSLLAKEDLDRGYYYCDMLLGSLDLE